MLPRLSRKTLEICLRKSSSQKKVIRYSKFVLLQSKDSGSIDFKEISISNDFILI